MSSQLPDQLSGQLPGQSSEQEGTIKFSLDFNSADPILSRRIDAACAWRKILFKTELIGQDPERYDGFGYGNISVRIDPARLEGFEDPGKNIFAISGTQTGDIIHLTRSMFALVTECDFKQNRIRATGPVRPSSESLTHGILYEIDEFIGCVIHSHSPEIWKAARDLDIPETSKEALYGTSEMTEEVARLFKETDVAEKRIFSMAGHEDGVVSFGRDVIQAGCIMLKNLAGAYERQL
ncbi:class II aldolase/adducin family protein [Desulfobacterales bacterium HSG16]|nr:class II aldolase/adducin family protein [Desulfobacterales bacterium HSG16]